MWIRRHREVALASEAVRFAAVLSVKGTVTTHSAQLHGLVGGAHQRQSACAL